MPQGLSEAIPRIRLALTPPIQPCAQHPTRQRQGPLTALCVVRDGIRVPMTLHPRLGLPQPVARGQSMTVSAAPIRPPSQCLPPLLPRRLALDLADAMTGFATKAGHPQAREVLGVFPSSVGLGPCLSSEFQMPRLLLSQLQMELPPGDPRALHERTRHPSGLGNPPGNPQQNGTNRLRPDTDDAPDVGTRYPRPNGDGSCWIPGSWICRWCTTRLLSFSLP
jgi:hypothetical protein